MEKVNEEEGNVVNITGWEVVPDEENYFNVNRAEEEVEEPK